MARGAVLSPDNRHLYVAAITSDAVTVFSREPTLGHLTFVESLRDGGQDGIGQPIDRLNGSASVVVSPLGEHVYVAARDDNAIDWFRRDASTGRLTFLGKVIDGQQDGAGKTVDGLNGVMSVTLSPDGSHAYAAGYQENAVAVFHRNSVTGDLPTWLPTGRGKPSREGRHSTA